MFLYLAGAALLEVLVLSALYKVCAPRCTLTHCYIVEMINRYPYCKYGEHACMLDVCALDTVWMDIVSPSVTDLFLSLTLSLFLLSSLSVPPSPSQSRYLCSLLSLYPLLSLLVQQKNQQGAISYALLTYTLMITWFVVEYLYHEHVHLYTYDFFAERVGGFGR